VQYANWEDLKHLIDRPWKDRLWTYQEILLASHPIIVCGTKHVQWSDFEWTLLSLRNMLADFPRALVAWESITFDRAQVGSTARPNGPNILQLLEEHETFVKRMLFVRRVFNTAWRFVWLAFFTASLIVGVVSAVSKRKPRGNTFRLADKTEAGLLVMGMVGITMMLTYMLLQVRPAFGSHREINDTSSDDLVGALYQRAASDPRDMAYGIWSILRIRGASDLIEPTYEPNKEEQIPKIYWRLTVCLLEITNNLRILNIAAARRLPGYPSWVPDWCSFDSNPWRTVSGLPGTDLYGTPKNARFSPESERSFQNGRARQQIYVDATRRVLMLRARELGAICDQVSFHPTSVTFKAEERGAHVENLQGMLQWAKWAKGIGYIVTAERYTPPVHERLAEIMPLSAAATWPRQKERFRWGKTLIGPRAASLNTHLTCWMDGDQSPKWFRRFMAVQIRLCTLIAEMKQKICYASNSSKPGLFYIISCSEETRVNDLLISVGGLLGSIVMRKRGDLPHSVELVSPCMQEGAKIKKTKSTNNGGSIPLASQWVEYSIH
jgi:hypothetical protein